MEHTALEFVNPAVVTMITGDQEIPAETVSSEPLDRVGLDPPGATGHQNNDE